jgi:hypothetical protein
MLLRICIWNCTPLDSRLFYFSFISCSFLRNYSYIAGGIFNTGRKDFILCEYLCEISGFRRGVTEAFALVGCSTAYVGSWLPTFEGGTGSLSRTVSNQLPAYSAERPRGAEVSRLFFFSGVAEFSVLLKHDAVSLVT